MPALRRMHIKPVEPEGDCEPQIIRQYPQGDGRMRELAHEKAPQGGGGGAPAPAPGANRDLAQLALGIAQLRAQFERLEAMQNRVLAATYANLMTRESYPITAAARTFPGSNWGTTAQYLSIYRNETRRPISVQVQVNFGSIAGTGLQLSYGLDNAQAFEVLSSAGQVSSGWILLKPDQQIYASPTVPAIDLTGAIVRVLEFDPVKFFGMGIVP